MDKIVKPDRGRVYQCTICDFLGERKTALKHFKTKHVTAHEEQYHCNICSFHSHDFQLIKRHGSFYKPHNALKEEFMKDGNYYLKEISNQLKRNHDEMEKIEIAVRRSYSHQNVRPVYNHNRYIPPRSPIRNRPPFNPVNRPLKRKFIQEKSVSL